MILSAGVSDKGCVRAENQDCIFWSDPQQQLFILADGMGGEQCGERASALTLQVIRDFFEARPDPESADEISWPFGYNSDISADENRLTTAFGLANREVRRQAQENGECEGMGATVVAISMKGSAVTLGSVGDCRAYLLRAGQLTQITTDDTVIQQLLANGEIAPDEVHTHPLRHQVTAAIGAHESLEVQTFEFGLEYGDRLLLCSDGLHGVITDAEIQQEISKDGSPQHSIDELLALVRDQGGPDNISCILIEYREEHDGAVGTVSTN